MPRRRLCRVAAWLAAFVFLLCCPVALLSRMASDRRSTLVVENMAGVVLKSVFVAMQEGDNPRELQRSELSEGGRIIVSSSESDLFVFRLEFELGADTVTWAESTCITYGETLRLRIGPEGSVSTHFGRE